MDNKGQEISVNSMIGFIYSRGRAPLPGAVSMYHHWIVINCADLDISILVTQSLLRCQHFARPQTYS